MEIKIEIDEKELQEEMTQIIARKVAAGTDRNIMKREIAESVREVVYAEKQFIIDMVVSRATKEITNKALPKLLENLTNK